MDSDLNLELDVLAEIGRSITRAATDLEELVEVTFLEVARLFETDFFQLGLYKGDQYSPLIWVRDGTREKSPEFTIDPDREGLIGWIRRTGKPLLVDDFKQQAESLPAAPSYEAQDPPNSAIFVPLQFSGAVIGLIGIQSRKVGAFNDHQLRMLEIISIILAPALASIALKADTDLLSTRVLLTEEISRQLISLAPIQDRMANIVSLLMEGLNYQAINLFGVHEGKVSLLASSDQAGSSGDLESQVIPECAQEAIDSGELQFEQVTPADDEPKVEGDDSAPETFLQLAIPLRISNHILGALCLTNSAGELPSEEQLNSIEIIVTQLALALLEDYNYSQHQQEAWITTVLLEVARHAAQPGDPMAALGAVLQLATLLAGTDWAVLLLPAPNGNDLIVGPTAGLRKSQAFDLEALQINPSELGISAPFSESEMPEMLQLTPALSALLKSDSALALILCDREVLLGLLLLQGEKISEKRLSLLAGIGHQVSLRLENTRLIEEAATRRSLERELAMARSIQASFLPEEVPQVTGWELGVSWQVARDVGGDFYDFIPLPPAGDETQIGVVIADVSDKGIPAALYMALCRTLVRSVATAVIDPGLTLQRVNQLLISDTRADLFVSVFYGVWQPGSGDLWYANAGHNPPILYSTGHPASSLHHHNMVLGVEDGCEYESFKLELEVGQGIVFYTDGVTEAFDPKQQPFGIARLENTILSQTDLSAQELADSIACRVIEYQEHRDLSDDLTVLTLKRLV
jgi:serine phosphatase RsbU (regulator of sigma subunit)/transcriptional regulator with GAF, ATPase, and Fis domain